MQEICFTLCHTKQVTEAGGNILNKLCPKYHAIINNIKRSVKPPTDASRKKEKENINAFRHDVRQSDTFN